MIILKCDTPVQILPDCQTTIRVAPNVQPSFVQSCPHCERGGRAAQEWGSPFTLIDDPLLNRRSNLETRARLNASSPNAIFIIS
ncbi:hypothetical protein TNCV_4693011 [Trichonephila clavipes]|nr:hypothetical protein TNCV_4693011 [Trichonephila clavipes]